MRRVVFLLVTLLLGAFALDDLDAIPDVNANVGVIADDWEWTFFVTSVTSFEGMEFSDKSAYQYASYCGFDASEFACAPSAEDLACGTASAEQPCWYERSISHQA